MTHTLHTAPVDAEAAVLGWALSGRDIDDIDLTPDDFYQPLHGEVWRICKAIRDQGRRPEPMGVLRELSKVIPDSPADPHAPMLHHLIEQTPVGGADWHARQVFDGAYRRRLQDTAAKLAQLATTDRDPAELADIAVAELTRPIADQIRGRTIGEILPAVCDLIETGSSRGTPTPWSDLTDKLNGWRPDALYIVGARPAVGKSIMGVQAATHLSRTTGKAVFIASVEMGDLEIGTRILSEVAGVSQSRMNAQALNEHEWNKISQAQTQLQDLPIIIDESGSQSLASIRAGARKAARQPAGLGMVVVDYLQLVTPRDRKLPREQQVAEVSRGLKQLAKELHVPVVALAQLNRGDGHSPPTMANLRESGSIEADADVVLLLHQDDQMPGEVQVIVGKNRHGPCGQFPLQVWGAYARMTSPEQRGA